MIGGGRTCPTLSHLGGGGTKDFAKKGECIYCLLGEKVKFPFLHSFELVMQDSHPSLYSAKKLYHLHISDSF